MRASCHILSVVSLVLTVTACERLTAAPEARLQPATQPKSSAPRPLSALSRGYAEISQAARAHKIVVDLTLKTETPIRSQPPLEQHVEIIKTPSALKLLNNTHALHGYEARLLDGWLYTRRRHGQFVRRKPSPGEVAALGARIYSSLPTYAQLLAPFIAFSLTPEQRFAGRHVRTFLLSKASRRHASGTAAASGQANWREKIDVEQLSGKLIVDAINNIPLWVELKASWRFFPPAQYDEQTGIPKKLASEAAGRMTLALKQTLSIAPAELVVEPIAPAELLVGIDRLRLFVEQDVAAGRRKLPEQWRQVAVPDDRPAPAAKQRK